MAARTSTIDVLVSRLDKLCDIEGDGHLTSAEKFEIMNSAIAETWDLLCDSGLAEKYVTSANITTVAGQLEYPIFTAATNFYRIHKLYAVEGTTAYPQYRALTRVNPSEIQVFTAPTVSGLVVKMYYIPYSPILTTGQTFDGINGWEEHTLMVAACAVKFKKDESYAQYDRRRAQLEQRIRSNANIDFGEPLRISRKYSRRRDPFVLFNNQINGYGVRGDKIELYSYNGYSV